jgi:hypothetical protein
MQHGLNHYTHQWRYLIPQLEGCQTFRRIVAAESHSAHPSRHIARILAGCSRDLVVLTMEHALLDSPRHVLMRGMTTPGVPRWLVVTRRGSEATAPATGPGPQQTSPTGMGIAIGP